MLVFSFSTSDLCLTVLTAYLAMDIDPLPDFLKLNIPIIVGMGEKDESVPVESALFLDAKFKEAGKNNFTLKVYPESDHRLSGNGVSHRSEFFAELSRLLQPTHNIAVKRDAPKAARPSTLRYAPDTNSDE